MIASRRGLLVVAAVAMLLAILVVIDLARTPAGPPDRALLPGADDVVALQWTRGDEVTLATHAAPPVEGWQLAKPVIAGADASTVNATLAALRSARWHRRGPVGDAGAITATLALTPHGREARTIGLGAELTGSEQQWLVVGDHAVLVDRWVARALFPPLLSLVERRPFEHATDAPITLGDVSISAPPRRAASVLLASELAATVEKAVSELELVALAPRDATSAEDALAIEAGAVRGRLGGACPGGAVLLAVDGLRGCATAAAATAVRDVLAKLRQPPQVLVEPRPVPFEVAKVTLLDGSVLDVTKQLLIDGAPADPTRVTELLAALAAPAAVAKTPASGGDPITVTAGDGTTLTLELVPPNLVHRQGEPVTLVVTAEAWAILARKKPDLRDPTLWIEDPLAIEALTIADTTYARGAVVGEWTRDNAPVPPAAAARLDTLVSTLATLRALSPAPPTKNGTWPVTLRLRDPGGTRERALGVGAIVTGGCPILVGSERFYVARQICESVGALAR